jgi:8-oxo-dGTP pyrophosphatase MutT (NUDIX family)
MTYMSIFQATPEQPYHLSIGAVVRDEQGRVACHHFDKEVAGEELYVLMRESMEAGEALLETLARGLKEEFGFTAEPVGFLGAMVSHPPFGDGAAKTAGETFEKTTLYFECRLVDARAYARDPEDPEFRSRIEWHAPMELIELMAPQVTATQRDDLDEREILQRVLA